MKPSRYNFIYCLPDSDSSVAFNAITGAIAVMDPEHREWLSSLRAGKNACDARIEENMKRGGFVVDDDLDERKLIQFRDSRGRFLQEDFGITIAPTLDCNFACVYCVQKNSLKDRIMGTEVQDAIVEFLGHKARGKSFIRVAWYGGEPLLAWDVVKSLTIRIQEICRATDVQYFAGLVTNASLVSNEIASELEDLSITQVQVTIDGPQRIHDNRRVYRDGSGTYDDVIRGVRAIGERFGGDLSLRVNADQTNASESAHFLREIGDDLPSGAGIRAYLATVRPFNDCFPDSSCLSHRDYARHHFRFLKTAVAQGLEKKTLTGLPGIQPSDAYCAAVRDDGVVVTPDGTLYKCWSDVGIPEYSVGRIQDGGPNKTTKRYLDFMTIGVADRECEQCRLLPVCRGGCPRFPLDGGPKGCTSAKFMLREYLRSVAQDHLSDPSREPIQV